MNFEHFKFFTTDDFILDDDFHKIVNDGTKNQLSELVRSFPEKKEEIALAVKILRGMDAGKFHQDQQKKQDLWNQILQSQKKKIQHQYFRYAASILLLIGIGTSLFFLTRQKPDAAFVSVIRPAESARLVLANGKMLNITSEQSKIQITADGSGIVVNDSSSVKQAVSGESLNQLIVPFGKRSFITLSEGTKVWLNSGSKLTFPSIFSGQKREVTLVGEALFEVSKDQSKPFFVKTDAFKLKVYGTKFDVQVYEHDVECHVVLVEGKVSMSSNDSEGSKEVFLAPNQKATLPKYGENFEITNIENIEIYTAWVDGYLTFTNEEVPDVLKRVSRYYNANIEIESAEKMEKIYGKLDLKDDLERVLDGIAFISKMNYTKQGNKYVFKLN